MRSSKMIKRSGKSHSYLSNVISRAAEIGIYVLAAEHRFTSLAHILVWEPLSS
jgi:hypothetical protein